MPPAREATVRFRLGAPMQGTPSLTLDLEDDAGRLARRLPPRRLRTVVDFSALAAAGLASAFAVVPDGDAKVGSTQVIDLADPPEPPPSGKGTAVRLAYRFEKGWKFARVYPTQETFRPIDGKPRAVGFWVWGDGQGNWLRLRFVDASGETFQPGGFRLSWTGWRYVELPLDGRDSGHWGGKGDGTVDYPIRWDTLFLLDSATQQQTQGTVHVAAPTLLWEP